ncbi:MAG: protein translocase SEC61 complex subunit gamma [Desulfurococcales archaeon]|nr:protein translocase SEC61 complex subunit gamma [Desulfurococcales archaeon]
MALSVWGKIKDMVGMWRTIFLLAKKPDDEEFKLISKLTFLGFALVGGIAYIIHLIFVIATS